MSNTFDDVKGKPGFCVMPWLHLHAGTTGEVTLCCISNVRLRDENGESLALQTHTLSEIWNAPAFLEVRNSMAEGSLPRACSICYNHERLNGTSTRIGLNKWLLEDHPKAEENRKIIQHALAGQLPPLPGYVDIRLSNLCNLGCRMCSSDASSQIEKDSIHSQWSPYSGPRPRPGSNLPPLRDVNGSDVINDLKSLDDLYFIQLAGGEPTVNKGQVEWLRHLAESGKSRSIEIQMWTNFTTTNRSIFDILATFRQVSLVLSIDGHGPTYDYIRWPGRWDMIERNMAYIAPMRDRIALKMNAVVQAYNIFNLPRLLDWAQEHSIEVMLHNVTPQTFLDYRILSDELQQRARNLLSNYARELDPSKGASGSISNAIANLLSRTAEPLPDDQRDSNLQTFVQFTNDLDRKRNQSLAKVAPEIYADVCARLGSWPTHGRFTSV